MTTRTATATHTATATRRHTGIRRVLVVGNGMAGARFAEELRHRDPAGERFAVTVVGEEPHAAYNRVLLSNVLAGAIGARDTRLKPEGWWAARGIRVVTGARVSAVDLDARTATLHPAPPAQPFPANDSFVGERVGTPARSPSNESFAGGFSAQEGWDELVLATGSTSFLPPIAGLDAAGLAAGETAGVLSFRTVDDSRRIIEAAESASRAVVLGGGLLGLEAARGLLGRGVDVTIVHPQGFPMDRQLDVDGGAVLARVVRGIGARLVLGHRVTAYRPALPAGRAVVVLDDGTELAADLVVIAAGVRPRTDLARDVGLDVNRAIVVDDRLPRPRPHVHAIGECAEHRGEVPGLVQPGWDQARVLADVLTGADPAGHLHRHQHPDPAQGARHRPRQHGHGRRRRARCRARGAGLHRPEPGPLRQARASPGPPRRRDPARSGRCRWAAHPALRLRRTIVPRDRLALMLGRAVTRGRRPRPSTSPRCPARP